MTPLHRTAIGSCAALVALVLAGTLLLRGEGEGPFHSVETTVTPTVEVAGLPVPDAPAGTSELADLDRLAGTTLVLVLMAAVTALVSLLGVVASENLSLEGRRLVEVMLGAPPRWLVGGAAKLWGRRVLVAVLLGSALAVLAATLIGRFTPPGVTLARPAAWAGVAGLGFVAGLVALCALLPVRSLYRPGRPLLREAESQHLTDPRPRQFNRVLLITLQLSVAVAILAGSGLFLLSGNETGSAGVDGAGAGGDHAVVGLLSPAGEAAGDPGARAALYESALSAVRAAPELVAETLATPGAWIGRGPEGLAVNECGRCSTGGMPHPIHAAQVKHHAVMPGFFAQRGLRFVDGRGFGADVLEEQGVINEVVINEVVINEVVINQAYARAHFLDPPVIGKNVALGGLAGDWHVVVGVVSDVAAGGLGASGSPYSVYYSAFAHPPAEIELVAALAAPPTDDEDSLRVVRESLAMIPGGELMLTALKPAADELRRVYGTAPWLGSGSRVAGILAAVVAVLGMVGALRVHVRSRMQEMGIRAAVGAEPVALKRMILREAFRIGAVGTGFGLWGAILVVGILSPPSVDVFNAPLFLAVALLFLGAAVAAALPGARLAATAEPRSVISG